MKILGVDPGTHTGWCLWESATEYAEAQVDGGELHDPDGWEGELRMAQLVMLTVQHHDVDVIVCEDFTLRIKSSGWSSKREGLSAVRVGAALGALADEAGWNVGDGSFVWSQPSAQALYPKGPIGRRRMEVEGLWIVGSEHARSAAKHVGWYLRKHPKISRG